MFLLPPTRLKTIFSATFVLVTCVATQAQSLFYEFNTANEPYTEITTGTVLTSDFSLDNYSFVAPGFDAFGFPLHPSFTVGKNGYVVNTNYAVDRSFAFDPFLVGLKNHATLASELRAVVQINSNDTTLIVQWKNMGLDGMPDSDFVNFQVRLHKPMQTIEFHFGARSISSDSLLATLGGVTTEIALLNAVFTGVYEEQVLYGDPASPSVETSPTSLLILDAAPAPNTVYRFSKTLTSIDDQTHINAIQAYPNPFDNIITITNSVTFPPSRYELFDALGQQVESGMLTQNTIDTHCWTTGIYTLVIRNDKLVQRVRLIKH